MGEGAADMVGRWGMVQLTRGRWVSYGVADRVGGQVMVQLTG